MRDALDGVHNQNLYMCVCVFVGISHTFKEEGDILYMLVVANGFGVIIGSRVWERTKWHGTKIFKLYNPSISEVLGE